MKQGCKIIKIGKFNAIMCGGEPNDHECNEDAIVYDTFQGERHFFKDTNEASIWYDKNFQLVQSGSVACSICNRAVIDNAIWF